MELSVQPRKQGPVSLGPALVTALLLAITLLLAGCTSNEDVDPQAVLNEAIPAMRALESFTFTYDVTRPEDTEPVQGTDVVALDGAVDSAGSMEAGIDLTQNGIPLHINFVAVGDTHYVQNPLTQRWQSVAASDSPVGELNLGASAIQILERIQSPAYDGQDEIEDVACHRITGTVAAEDVEGIAQAVSVDSDFPVEVWVGVEDSLIRRITLDGAATTTEPEGTVRTIELQGFNEPVEIEPPA
jgi:hypothetical protein